MRIKISDWVSQNLALRNSANRFFDQIEANSESIVEVDFANVETITRSFTHQYLLRKEQSDKQIVEKNIPENVQNMFDLVKSSVKRHITLDVDSARVLTI